MSSQTALIAYSVFVLAILVVDSRRKPDVSIALWTPFIWLLILASRPVAAWFNGVQSVTDLINGEAESPIDRNILLGLMVLGVLTLMKRKLKWIQWLKANPWIVVLFLYFGVSTMWSDFPDIAFKRWIRALGALIMILVVLSERDPIAAIRVLFRRCAYVLIPLSVVLDKYYRSFGVNYNSWTGEEFLIGVTTNKNALGRLCLISGLFLFWDLIMSRGREQGKAAALNRAAVIGMLFLTIFLLLQSKSSTALGSFILGSSVLLVLGFPPIRNNAKFLGTFLVIIAVVVVGLDGVLNLKEMAVGSLGRDMTLTDRTFIWQDLLALGTNPVFGVGYDSFWLGERLEMFVRKHLVAEAHNGYIELYLELGIVGIGLVIGLVWSVFLKAKKSLMREETFDYGRLQLAVLAVFLIYNMTEAAYKVTAFMAFTLIVIAIERPSEESAAEVETGTEWRPQLAPPTFRPRVSTQSGLRRVQR
jgi:O-antigen ligase